MYKVLTFKEVSELRSTGMTLEEIGKIFGVHKGVISRVLRKGDGYTERVGIKKSSIPSVPIWERMDPKRVHPFIISCVIHNMKRFGIYDSFIMDYVLTRLLQKDYSNINNTEAYINRYVTKVVLHWSHNDPRKNEELQNYDFIEKNKEV
ncbi:MAG: hypothetical protein DRI61_08965 [Chloroflexi bacterium]|nr:MAG: hypothetical protein DRI61_08965 [Chloroflexota bacterium]